MYGLTGISKVADSTRRRGAPAATLVALALVVLLIALAGRAAALAEELRPDVTVRAADSTLTGAEYRAAYGYTTDESADVYITGWQVNGGSYGSNAPARALDGDFSTFWETNTPNSDDFANAFTLTFSSVATVDRVLYRVRTDGQAGRGYPLALTVYASADEDGETFERVGYAESALTRSAVVFGLPRAVECRRLRLEFTEAYSDLAGDAYAYASAAEILPLRPEESAIGELRGLFADYTYTSFVSGTEEARVRELVSETTATPAYGISAEVRFLAERALSVLEGETVFDDARELSTADSAELPRRGSIAGYARNTLKTVWMGTDRIATGVTASPGEVLTVFVDAPEGDPLPSVVFTQHIGHWSSWKGGSTALSRGINFVTVPNLYKDGWSTPTVPGGPVYLTDPYTDDEQSANVRVYIDGGHTFPLYRAGGDVRAFEDALDAYAEEMAQTKLPDVAEVQSDNVLLTLSATGVRAFVERGGDVRHTCSAWDSYLKKLYAFDGIAMSPGGAHYDERAPYLNVNIRLMQPYGAAYAYGDHVGIQSSWEGTALDATEFGWGYTHELGHMMDIPERTVGEYTNNMWSQYDRVTREGQPARGDFAAFTLRMTPDDNARNAYSQKDNFAVPWWHAESYRPGFWGAFDNNYRYEDRAGITNATELHVYFASLAAGVDLGYYFERMGFYYGNANAPFTTEGASEAYKTAVSAALAAGRITDDRPKLWYLGADAYAFTVSHAGAGALYDESDAAASPAVVRNGSDNVVIVTDGSDDERHLGYEVLRAGADGAEVIGFTYGRTYTDANAPADAIYCVRAYDRFLNASGMSAQASAQTREVAVTGGTAYSTLAEAVANADAGGMITLTADTYEAGITIDKNVTVHSDGAKIYGISGDSVFIVGESGALTLSGSLTLDGMGEARSAALVRTSGTVTIGSGVTITGGNNSAAGGGVNVAKGSLVIASGGSVTGNIAANGGGIAATGGGNCSVVVAGNVTDNTASGSGGGIYANGYVNVDGGYVTDNAAGGSGGGLYLYGGAVTSFRGAGVTGNTAGGSGGGVYADGKTDFSGNATMITGNVAASGGGMYVASSSQSRAVTLTLARLSGNSAEKGSQLYVGGVMSAGGALTVTGEKTETGGSVYVADARTLTVTGGLTLTGSVSLPSGGLTFPEDLTDVTADVRVLPRISAAGDFTVATFAGSADTRAVKAKAWDGTRERACSLSEDGKRLYVAVITLATDSGATMLPTDGNGRTLPELPAAEGKRALGWRAESGELLLPGENAGGVSALFTAEYALEYTLIFGDRGSFTLIEGESVAAPSPSDPDFLGWAPEGSDESYDGTVVLTADLAALADDSRTIRFRELRAAPPSEDNAPDPDDSGDPDALPLWPFMIGGALAVIVVGGAIIVILGLRKQRNDRR